MDRPIPTLTALAAVTLLAAAWMVMRGPGEPAEAPEPPGATVYRNPLPTPVAGAETPQSRPRYHVPAVIDWLPSLSDTTHTVSAEFALEDAQPSPQASLAEAASPELLFPLPAEAMPANVSAPDSSPLPQADDVTEEAGPASQQVAGDATPSEVAPEASDFEPAAEPVPAAQADDVAAADPPQPAKSAASESDPQPKPDLLLVPSYDPASRSQELELIARQADAHTRYGFELAGKEAYFSAESEFVMALRLVAQGLDTEYRTKAHSRTLAAGLTALSEAEDFIPQGAALEADLDLPAIIRRHRTPILHDVPCDSLTPLDAMQSYLTFAQEQLSFAGGGEVASSMALYGLGKLHKTLAVKLSTKVRAARPKAVVFYQASLLVAPRNYMASNDLGVMLAQSGRYEDARAALEHSLAISPQSAAWHNLSVVYGRLGAAEAAEKASRLAEAGSSAGQDAAGQTDVAVEWVDPYEFARAAGQTLPPPSAETVPPPSAPKQAADWLPWKKSDARK